MSAKEPSARGRRTQERLDVLVAWADRNPVPGTILRIARELLAVDVRDRIFGIFNRKLELIAMAHLAYPTDFRAAGFAEFGVSVSRHARGRGYGTRLFERAAIHAVNDGVGSKP